MSMRFFRRRRVRDPLLEAAQQRQRVLRDKAYHLAEMAPVPFTAAGMVATYVKDHGIPGGGGLELRIHDYGDDNTRLASGDTILHFPGLPNTLRVGAHVPCDKRGLVVLHELAHLLLEHPSASYMDRDGIHLFDSVPEKEAEWVATQAMWLIDRKIGQGSWSRSMRAVSAAAR